MPKRTAIIATTIFKAFQIERCKNIYESVSGRMILMQMLRTHKLRDSIAELDF